MYQGYSYFYLTEEETGTVGTVKGTPRRSPLLDSICKTIGIQLHK